MKFSCQIEQTPLGQIFHLAGDIDENADFKKIVVPESGKLVLDLGKIELINSLGLRSWVQWVRKLNHLPGIFLRNCPYAVVHQINVLSGFMPPDSIVESFEVPFFCESCKNQHNYMAERVRDFIEATADTPEKIMMALEKRCDKCGKTSTLDAIPAQHFKFLRSRR